MVRASSSVRENDKRHKTPLKRQKRLIFQPPPKKKRSTSKFSSSMHSFIKQNENRVSWWQNGWRPNPLKQKNLSTTCQFRVKLYSSRCTPQHINHAWWGKSKAWRYFFINHTSITFFFSIKYHLNNISFHPSPFTCLCILK